MQASVDIAKLANLQIFQWCSVWLRSKSKLQRFQGKTYQITVPHLIEGFQNMDKSLDDFWFKCDVIQWYAYLVSLTHDNIIYQKSTIFVIIMYQINSNQALIPVLWFVRLVFLSASTYLWQTHDMNIGL